MLLITYFYLFQQNALTKIAIWQLHTLKVICLSWIIIRQPQSMQPSSSIYGKIVNHEFHIEFARGCWCLCLCYLSLLLNKSCIKMSHLFVFIMLRNGYLNMLNYDRKLIITFSQVYIFYISGIFENQHCRNFVLRSLYDLSLGGLTFA